MADLAVGPTHAHALRRSEHLRVEIDGLGGAVDDEVRADLRVAVGNRLHGRAHARSPSCIRVHAGSREGTYVRSLTTGTSCRKGRLARQDTSRVPTRALLDLVRELSPDGVLRLLRELTHEPRRPRDEHEAAHAPRRDA